jgi:chemotaxis protein MotB
MSRRRHQHHQHHEEHIDESWLIPYADILTLLLALFIVLFASAQVDQKKFEHLAQSFSDAFRGNTSIFESNRTSPQIVDGRPRQPDNIPPVTATTGDKNQLWQQETAQLVEVKKMLDRYIQDNNLKGGLETALVEDGLMIRIKDTALFPSGSADLLPQSRVLAAEIAKILSTLPQNIIISGHTDNVPINTYEFPTNWDLSSKRALNFMKFILAQETKLKPERFSSVGHGEYRPIALNDTDEGRSKNRRVEVLIIRRHN